MVQAGSSPVMPEQLLISLAEQLKLPLLQIARRAELAALGEHVEPTDLGLIAESALRLIDSYVLSVRLAEAGAHQLELEPITISSVLYDTAHELSGLAKFYGIRLELLTDQQCSPVLANRQGLQAALTSLGTALIEALPATDSTQLTLELSAHRSRYGIVAGMYTDASPVTAEQLRRGTQLASTSRQALVGMSSTNGAGVFVADAILQAMQLRLQASRHHHLQGLATMLQPNPQLQLI